MPRRSLIALAPVLAALWGCVGLAGRAALPVGWESLQEAPRPFAALYRLECCGRRNLLVTLRCDGTSLDVAITAPPGAAVLRAFIAPAGSWLYDGEANCVARLSEEGLPLGDGHVLPLRPRIAAVLMSGGVPPGSRAVAAAGAWVSATTADGIWSNRVAGPSPHVVEARLVDRDGGLVLDVGISEHRLQRIPAVLELHAGGERFVLNLVSWRGSDELKSPGWLSLARCGGGG